MPITTVNPQISPRRLICETEVLGGGLFKGEIDKAKRHHFLNQLGGGASKLITEDIICLCLKTNTISQLTGNIYLAER